MFLYVFNLFFSFNFFKTLTFVVYLCYFLEFQPPQNIHVSTTFLQLFKVSNSAKLLRFYFVYKTFHSFKFRKTFTFLFSFRNFYRFQILRNFYVSVQFSQILSFSNSVKISRLCLVSATFIGLKFRKTFTLMFSFCNFFSLKFRKKFTFFFVFATFIGFKF